MTEPAPRNPATRQRGPAVAPRGTSAFTASLAGPDATVGRFAAELHASEAPTHGLRDALADATAELAERFRRGEPVELLVSARAGLVDAALTRLWQHTRIPDTDFALVAVGGYGRAELHPGSDIDVLILVSPDTVDLGPVEQFVALLWDTGLEVGHSVRTVNECIEQASADLTVVTTLMEARLLAGLPGLFESMTAAIAPNRVWDSPSFFAAKLDEQRARHQRYDDTGYNLEPNVKGSPGGLRDIQMLGWVARRHVGARSVGELVSFDFLSEGQAERLVEARRFLWTIRFGLHVLTGRREDRLLFDHQKALAELLGYEDARYTLGVEQMMQRYYRMVMLVTRTNEMLLQLFEEDILMPPDQDPRVLDEAFVSRNGYLQSMDDNVFSRDPSALLTVFRLLQRNPDLKGVSARTIGLIRRNRHLVDEQFRQHPRNHRLFLDLLRAPLGVTRELRRMNRYGILGRYIPAFGRIVGRMQYDLFHAYTVDEHTLFVVSNLRKFALGQVDGELQHCAEVMQQLPDQALALLSGLFHDIAKGRGGDHSELGAMDALAFCRENGLDDADAELVSWLVANHLVLSMTAQKKDLSDPEVIAHFAQHMGDRRRLDYLYVLTVADVQATNPKLWNSWKAKLFRDLYDATRDALERGPGNPLDRRHVMQATQAEARAMLAGRVAEPAIQAVWSVLGDDYFVRHSADEVRWHTEELAALDLEQPHLRVSRRGPANTLALMLYTPHVRHTFAAVTACLDELGLSVLDARIEQLDNDFSLDTYIVTQADGESIDDTRLREIERRVLPVLATEDGDVRSVHRRMSRQQRMFSTRTRVSFRSDETARSTVMELICADHPGLLLKVGITLIDCGIYITAAKIVTIGERAEDVFYLTNHQELPLSAAEQEALRDALYEALPGGAA